MSDLKWLVATDVEAMAPPDQEGARWSHKNADQITRLREDEEGKRMQKG